MSSSSDDDDADVDVDDDPEDMSEIASKCRGGGSMEDIDREDHPLPSPGSDPCAIPCRSSPPPADADVESPPRGLLMRALLPPLLLDTVDAFTFPAATTISISITFARTSAFRCFRICWASASSSLLSWPSSLPTPESLPPRSAARFDVEDEDAPVSVLCLPPPLLPLCSLRIRDSADDDDVEEEEEDDDEDDEDRFLEEAYFCFPDRLRPSFFDASDDNVDADDAAPPVPVPPSGGSVSDIPVSFKLNGSKIVARLATSISRSSISVFLCDDGGCCACCGCW